MNLNDKIKKHELLIEELNNGVDNLLKEFSIVDIFSALRNPPMFITKKVLGKMIGSTTEELEKKKEEKSLESTKKDVKKLTKDILKLEELLKKLQDIKKEGLDFNNIWLEFKEKVSIGIENFKPGFERVLEGTMKFSVIGIDNENKFMELKHDSFGKKSMIKLYFTTLETYIDQQGDISLIYSKYGDPDMEPVKGEEKKVVYRITKKQ